MNPTTVILQKAYQHIKAGEKQDALDLLTPVVYAEPENLEAWYLLGFAHSDFDQRIIAFEHVLRLDPSNQPAQKQIARLRAEAVIKPATPESIAENARVASDEMVTALRWMAAILAVLLVCLTAIIVAVWWLLR